MNLIICDLNYVNRYEGGETSATFIHHNTWHFMIKTTTDIEKLLFFIEHSKKESTEFEYFTLRNTDSIQIKQALLALESIHIKA